MKKMIWTIIIGVAAATSVLIVAAQQQDSPQVQHRLIPVDKIRNPAPPSDDWDQYKKNSIGKGRVAVTTAQPASFWQEQIDIGETTHATVTTDFLYDPNVGVIYGYRYGDFACKNGDAESGSILEARYTAGNKAGKPPGSGWYVAELHTGKCGAKESGIYGCKLDASATATDCGLAAINNQTGEIELARAQ